MFTFRISFFNIDVFHGFLMNTNNTTDMDNIVLGIDLGTRFSCVSLWRNNRFEIINDQFGNRTIPSVVSFYKSARLVGHNALAMKEVNPKNTIYDIKRLIGKRIDDPTIEQVKKIISYDVVDDETPHQNIMVQLDNSDHNLTTKVKYRPEEITAYILIEIKNMAKKYLKHDVCKAVITVPAYFNDAQRQATLDAGRIAGLEVIKVINEPTAAALAYGLGNRTKGNIMIYDFGAGTLDVSLMNINNGTFRTLAVSGNNHLGGEDIDYLLMNLMIREFRKKYSIRNFEPTKLSMLKLKQMTEHAKKILSSTDQTIVCIDNFYQDKKLYHNLTKFQLETVCNDLFIMAIKPLNDAIESAGLTRNQIDDVIMVGGSTRIPKIQQLILEYFNNTNITRLNKNLNPDEVVSAGAAIYGYIMTNNTDPFSENIQLLDITPLSLGVEVLKKKMSVLIPRNTVIPVRKEAIYSTDEDFQDTVNVKIFEGERKLTKDNFHVGTFELSGIEKGPRGYPVIKITFEVDLNGILQVTAYEKRSNVKKSIQITSTWGAKGRMSQDEIGKIIKEAEFNKTLDEIYSLKVGLHYNITQICQAILINIKDDALPLTDADKKKIKMDVKNNIKWLKEKSLEELQVDELKIKCSRLEKLYSPLIAHSNKNKDKFEEVNISAGIAEVYGDDDNPDSYHYEKINIPNDPSEYDKEEVKALKKTIMDMGKNLISIVNNPVSKFKEEDINLMRDYIDTVIAWLWTTSATTTIEFVAKIDEINKFSEEIMQKYEETSIFEKNDDFTAKDELQLMCVTLNTSIKSNYFSLKESDTEKLVKIINDTMIWLLEHPNESNDVYIGRVKNINEVCNQIYHSLHKIKELENMTFEENQILMYSDSEESDNEETTAPMIESNKIKEDIDSLMNKLPNKPIRRKNNNTHSYNNKSEDVLLKIDINKLVSGSEKTHSSMNLKSNSIYRNAKR